MPENRVESSDSVNSLITSSSESEEAPYQIPEVISEEESIHGSSMTPMTRKGKYPSLRISGVTSQPKKKESSD